MPYPKKKVNLEEMMAQLLAANKEFIATSSKRMDDTEILVKRIGTQTEASLQNHTASIKTIEV